MKGNIYKISYKNIIYVGSTIKCIHERFNEHLIGYLCYKDNYQISLKPYFKKHGIKKFKIKLIKQYEVTDRKHLFSKEQLWINKYRQNSKYECVNIANPIRFLLSKHMRAVYYRRNKRRKC